MRGPRASPRKYPSSPRARAPGRGVWRCVLGSLGVSSGTAIFRLLDVTPRRYSSLLVLELSYLRDSSLFLVSGTPRVDQCGLLSSRASSLEA